MCISRDLLHVSFTWCYFSVISFSITFVPLFLSFVAAILRFSCCYCSSVVIYFSNSTCIIFFVVYLASLSSLYCFVADPNVFWFGDSFFYFCSYLIFDWCGFKFNIFVVVWSSLFSSALLQVFRSFFLGNVFSSFHLLDWPLDFAYWI